MVKLPKGIIRPLILLALIVLAVFWLASHRSHPSAVPEKTQPKYSTDEAASLWAVVNKGRALPTDYVPAGLTIPVVPLRYGADSPQMQLRPEAAVALQQLVAGAKGQGLSLMLASGYRSYEVQVNTYQSEVAAYGQATADSESARPGHSEHQTGLAADLEPLSRQCEVQDCFADTAEGKWLAANAYKYGFIIRYQKSSAALTGYQYEPWHIRFVGSGPATQLHQSNQTLEQYFKLPTYTDYPAQIIQLK